MLNKDPDATIQYGFDWSDWLDTGDTVASAVWTIPAGITKVSQAETDTTTTVVISGGTLGQIYTVICHVVTVAGLSDDRDFTILVSDVRNEMRILIGYLRQYGSAGTDDVFNHVNYWTDKQLQDILDAHAQHAQVLLVNYTGTSWSLHQPRHVMYDSNAQVVDASNTVYGAPYKYNVLFGEILFDTAPAVPTLYVTGLKVNIWEALADLWAQKAQQRFDYIDWKAGNNKMNMSTEYAQCCQQRDYYRARTIRRFPRVSSRFVR